MLGVAHHRSYPAITRRVSLLSPLVIMGGTPAAPSLPAPGATKCISSCCSSHLQIVRNISSVIPCCFSMNSVGRCRSHAPSWQMACLYTRSALQQACLTFNSNYMFIVTKPQSLDILAQCYLQKQSKTWHMCRSALSLKLHVSLEKYSWLGYACLLNEPETIACCLHQSC